MNYILYPMLTVGFYKFCKYYYKCILHYHLLVIDMYDNDNNNINSELNTEQTNLCIACNQIIT